MVREPRHARAKLAAPAWRHQPDAVEATAPRHAPLRHRVVVSPSPSLSPADVVTSQMTALQKGDVRAAFEFASPANRVNTGPWQNFEMMVRQTPAYSPLVQCSSFEIVGALPFGDERMRCRVRVKPAGSSSAPFAVADPVCIFNWSLSKQTTKRWPDDPLLGCWMVDGVMPE